MRTRIRQRLRASFDDLELLLDAFDEGVFSVEELDRVVEWDEKGDPLQLWTLPALLFLFTRTSSKTGTQSGLFSDSTGRSELEVRCGLFDTAAESGVKEVIERENRDEAIEDIDNKLTVELGPDLAELKDEDLPTLPEEYLNQLLVSGEIDEQTYGEAVKERFKRAENGDVESLKFPSDHTTQ